MAYWLLMWGSALEVIVRNFLFVITASLVAVGSARAQPLPDDRLIDEQDYLNQPSSAMPPQQSQTPQYPQYPQYLRSSRTLQSEPAEYGSAQPYDGQPVYNSPPVDEFDEGDPSGDDNAQLDDGYEPDAYTDFQSTLSPYGSWTDVADYGEVWTPSESAVGTGFSPYATDGHWALTDYGWTWASNYSWGWAPFHYGRWLSLTGYGWCWIPGRVWGPSWVSWRVGGGYVGWSPLPPRGYRTAPPVGINTSWRFSTAVDFGSTSPHFLPGASVRSVFGRTAPVTNYSNLDGTRINIGPRASMISLAAGRTFTPAPLRTIASATPRAGIAPRLPLAARIPSAFGRRGPAGGGPMASRQSAIPDRSAFPQAAIRASSQPAFQTPVNRESSNRPAQDYISPSNQAQHRAPNYEAPYPAPAPRYNGAAADSAPRYNSPASYPAPRYNGAAAYSTPRYNSPAAYSAPRYSSPSYSAPSYNSGSSLSAPRYSAPASSSAAAQSAPSHIAPPPRYNAPAARPGGSSYRRR